ncbi:uncharacterized protein BT62DRAFT_1006874 [Guyanagaster necrorhizus]|uniref:Uncharacterized protein n=1 Tax=Guyanagaster necrorhizus TaxID=856835 RepID=A0A9P8ARH2_9AGAR|nr:uncharacterized protein BT62DRAFT_1006874 [Guyanagaster necrorhizus MCA 3950]KAG7445189.1 hypothetical protein BT62DRAFT_1006874 [Guyanagaster necrorhizus MCA 3950]
MDTSFVMTPAGKFKVILLMLPLSSSKSAPALLIDRLPTNPPAYLKCKFVYQTTGSKILPWQLLRSGQKILTTAPYVAGVAAVGGVSWLAGSLLIRRNVRILLLGNPASGRLGTPLVCILGREPSRYRHFLLLALLAYPPLDPSGSFDHLASLLDHNSDASSTIASVVLPTRPDLLWDIFSG